MANNLDAFGKFVRLKLTGEIVEVVDFNSTEVIVSFMGKILTMSHHQISPITAEEAARVAAKRALI